MELSKHALIVGRPPHGVTAQGFILFMIRLLWGITRVKDVFAKMLHGRLFRRTTGRSGKTMFGLTILCTAIPQTAKRFVYLPSLMNTHGGA